MEALYVTFLALFVIVAASLGLAEFLLGLPGRIAIARNQPLVEHLSDEQREATS